MKKTAQWVVITVAVAGWTWQTGPATAKSRDSFNILMHHREASECSDIQVTSGDMEVVRAENDWTVPGNTTPLHVRSGNNGGILVRGWDGPGYSVRACLGAAADTAAEAHSKLQQISVSRSGSTISVNGPDDKYWMAYLLIRAPRGAVMDLESNNSPIGLSNFTGSVEARNQNGPVSLREVEGKVRAEVHNGPISVEGGRGDYRLDVENGPLSVKLWGNQWTGEMEGHTRNGPLQLNIPAGYRSGVRVDSAGHAPLECRAEQCKDAQRTWDRPYRVEFGSSPVVRLSAENGPVKIQ